LDEVLPPPELRPSPEERRAKEQHDRLHAAQMENARKQALGDVNTPDDQLKWEEQAAAARDAGEKVESQSLGIVGRGLQDKASVNASGSTKAQDDLSAVRRANAEAAASKGTHPALREAQASSPRRAGQSEAGQGISNPSRASEGLIKDDQSSKGLQVASPRRVEHTRHDSDTIIVTPRIHSSNSQSPEHTRTGQLNSTPSSIQLAKKAAANKALQATLDSKINAQDASSGKARPKLELTTESRSPSFSANALARSQLQPPPQSGSDASDALEKLAPLKGAASDPDRDYLEPLFRIQAHDSPSNTLSKSLPDLVRMAPKALSTEDHMTTIHERVDFRMLRRIYQLQNANKWSLRQMEKAKEIDAPVSHQDYLIAEMKSMRRDFQAERKMKKSVCAWLAQRCAQWVGASTEERLRLQVRRKHRHSAKQAAQHDDSIPELDQAGESANEDDISPPTPRELSDMNGTLIVSPDLLAPVEELSHAGKLEKVLGSLPQVGIAHWKMQQKSVDMIPVSKFVEGRILPPTQGPTRKRSRYSYTDEEELLQAQPALKRRRAEALKETVVSDCALFDPENKQMRERIRSSTSFRPPVDILMPSTSFYENRNGSQWTWEDDQKVRSLAKEYTFNWSLIADELTIPGSYKSSYDRRTPWECFERWVELESLPVEMRKTPYFKTWFQRLEISAQTAERRYQAQVALLQQQAQQNSTTPRELQRRKLTPNRVEKRKGSRYLWVIDGCRKIAKKREQQAWKVSEAARTASQRKAQPDPNPQRQLLTPQEISRKRHQQDLAAQAALREQRQKFHEHQQRVMQARLAQQQQQHQQQQAQQQMQQQAQQAQGSHPIQAQQVTSNQGVQQLQHGRQQPGTPNMLAQQAQMQVNGQQMVSLNGQTMQHPQQPGRQHMPVGAQNNYRAMAGNGQHLNNQAQLQQQQARVAMSQHGNLQQQMAHAQARNGQFAGQALQMANGAMASPGGRTPQQLQQQQQQALLAAFNAQQQQQAAQAANSTGQHGPNGTSVTSGQQQQQQVASASPSMPPPPAPQQHLPQQLSSGHIPAIIQFKNQLRASNPNLSDEQLTQLATQQMQIKSQQQAQHQQQARQNAVNAAAGITAAPMAVGAQAYGQAKHAPSSQPSGYTPNVAQMSNGAGTNGVYNVPVGDGTNIGAQQSASGQQQAAMSPAVMAAAAQAVAAVTGTSAPSQAQAQAYAQKMWQRQMAQMQQRQQAQQQQAQQQQQQAPQQSPHQNHASPNVAHARLAASNSNSPVVMQASPSVVHARLAANSNGTNSPVVAHASPNVAQARLASSAGNNGSSPSIAHASPNMTPASPAAIAQMGSPFPANAATPTQGQARPTSRSSAVAAPQMQRLGSSGSMHGVLQGSPRGMPSPGANGVIGQSSPRTVQASMAR
jgi:chromatin modification-related protein VID21